MKKFIQLAVTAGAAVGLSAFSASAVAGAAGFPGGPHAGTGADHVVFVQTDDPAGNHVVAYDRADDGSLTWASTSDTGALGGMLNGSAVDHLASQGSLTYDAAHDLLYAVNAGSNTVSVFSVSGDQLTLRQVVDSGGTFPVSVTADGDFVYVLNAQDGGSVSGFRVAGGALHSIEGSTRSLGLVIPSDTTQYTHTPGQVAFSPNGSQLIVTTKATTSAIDIFAVSPSGRLSNAPVVNLEPGAFPFAVSFDGAGHLVVANAGNNSLATFTLGQNGTVTPINSVASGQPATCWVAPAQGFFFASNAGGPSVSGYQVDGAGNVSLLGATGTDPGTVDASASSGGQYLYVQTGGNGIVDEFGVNANGTLNEIGSVTVPGAAGGEGIVAF